jgi:hypothetical protein
MKNSILLFAFYLIISTSIGQTKLKTAPTWKAVFLNNNVYRTYNNIGGIFIVEDHNGNDFYSRSSQHSGFELDLKGREYIDYKIIREADGIIFFKILPCAIIDTNTRKITIDSVDGKCKCVGVTNAASYTFGLSTKATTITAFEKLPISSRLILTPILHPVKFRPAHSGKEPSLTGETTVSYNLGFRVKINKSLIKPVYLTFVPYGFGISNSQYFKENTNDRPVPGNISLTYWNFGAFVSFDRYNFGFFGGKDAMMTKSQKDWHYQNQLWFSFGFGYSLR